MVPATDLEVVEVVRRRDLDGAGALLRVGMLVGDDGDRPLDDRQPAAFADQVDVARVLRMNGDGGITQHRLGTGRGYGEKPPWFALDGITDGPQLSRNLPLLDLQVGNGGSQERVPVDQPLVAIDQAPFVQVDEYLADGGGKPLVHGEAFAGPVAGSAQAAQLGGDGTPRLRLPCPYPFDEAFAPQPLPGESLARELLLDHHLRGDAGVIGTGLPERIAPAHARIPDQNVLQRVVEGVPHV